jgi:acyl transferase domain-containing protein
MGLDLYRDEAVVRRTLDECDEMIRAVRAWSLLDELRRAPSRLTSTEYAQPAIFAVQLALSRLWAEWGVAPDTVIGHSMGEVAAACVAGALDVGDAIRLILDRGRVMQKATGSGRMASVQLSAAQAAAALVRHPQATIATVNGPGSVVIAGPATAIAEALADLRGSGVSCVPLEVDYAFHSPAVHRHGDELAALLADLPGRTADGKMVSTVDPDCADPVFDGAYWGRNVRDKVLLWPAVDRVLARGPAVFVEVGVHPVLNRALRDALAHRDRVGVVVSSLARGRPARSTMSQALAELHVAGVPIDWAAVYEAPRPYIPLPPVQLAGERHWLSKPVGRTARAAAGTAGPAVAVPALPAAAATSPEPAAPVPAVPVAAAAAPQPAAPQPAAPQPAALGQTAPWVAAGVASPQPDDGRAQGRERVAWVITGAVAEVLGYPAQRRIPRARGFYDLGMDSLTLVNFAARLGESLGCAVGPEVALEFPTIDQLTDHLVATLPVRPADAHEIDSVPGVDPVESGHRADVVDPGNRSTVDAAAQPRSAPVTASPASGSEPIAIIGMGCRLPGAEGLAAYWRLLCGAVDATSDIPGTRWDAGAMLATGPVTPGTVVTRRGAFLDQVDQFDNGFFQISAREARAMDPQQRIFLEVAWEALEDAGVDVAALRGGRTGLFVGLNSTDYQQLVTRNATDVDLYYGTGNSFSGAAGRLSYFLGVRGPSLAVDTACSSSLVAVHLAGRSLACGESEVAVVGGVNIMVTPTVFLAMSAGGALAPDGRCKTFDDAADGYGRGEGAGVVVLKTLARARADGDRVYAVIHGSAVNHNGASGGLTVPSLEAQVDVVRDALHGSGINPADVDYVEAHGTGTRLGDAIELTGLARAFGPGRADDQPLLVGSVKTNIGHLEAAAGVAGLIKTALAIRYGRIPGQLHTSQPTRQVDWDRLPLRIAVGNRPWPSTGRRVAGVSAFGFTGTNAHVVLAEPEREPEREPVPGPVSDSDPTWSTRPHLLVASARTAAALDATAARLRERLADSVEVEVATAGAGIAGRSDLADAGSAGQGGDLADVCYSAGARRSHLEHRLAVVGRTRLSLLDDLSPGPSGSGVRRAMVAWDEERPLVLVFGDRVIDLPWHRLGREEPALRRSLEAFSQVARELVGRSPDTELHAGAGPGGSGADDPLNVVAAQIALTALWRDYGIVADAAAGYGIGEIAAAHAAGLLDDRAAVLAATGPSGSARPTELVGPTRAALPLYRSGFGVSKAAAPARIAADLIDDGRTTLLDVGLAGAAEPVVRTAPEAFAVLDDGSTHDRPGCFMHVVASAYLRGCSLNWHRLYPPASRRVVSLPNYPWQRRRHWIDRTAPPFTAPRAADRAGQRAPAGAPVTTTATGDAPGVRSMTSLVAELHTLAAEQLEDRLLAFVLGGAADALGEPDGEIDPDKGFFELGMDSVMSVSLKGHVEQALGLELPATLAFDFPNARSLTRHLVAELTVVDGSNVDNGRSAPPAAAPEAVAPDDFDELSDDDLMSRLAASLASSESLLGGKG